MERADASMISTKTQKPGCIDSAGSAAATTTPNRQIQSPAQLEERGSAHDSYMDFRTVRLGSPPVQHVTGSAFSIPYSEQGLFHESINEKDTQADQATYSCEAGIPSTPLVHWYPNIPLHIHARYSKAGTVRVHGVAAAQQPFRMRNPASSP